MAGSSRHTQVRNGTLRTQERGHPGALVFNWVASFNLGLAVPAVCVSRSSSAGQTQAHTLSSVLPGGTQGPLLPVQKFPPLHQYKATSIANTAPTYSQLWTLLRVWRLLNPHSEPHVPLRTADGRQHQVASDSWASAHSPALFTWCRLQGPWRIYLRLGWPGQLPPASHIPAAPGDSMPAWECSRGGTHLPLSQQLCYASY